MEKKSNNKNKDKLNEPQKFFLECLEFIRKLEKAQD